jgi:hypothetical protein
MVAKNITRNLYFFLEFVKFVQELPGSLSDGC